MWRARGETLMGERAKDDTSLCPAVAQRNLLPDSRGKMARHCWWSATTEKILNSAGNERSLGASQVTFQRISFRSV